MQDKEEPILSIESRLRRLEDEAEIRNLIAIHPLFADTGSSRFIRRLWAENAVFKRSDGQGTMTLEDMEKTSVGAAHQTALEGGLAHFCGNPFIRLEGERATAISYLQLLTPDPRGELTEVSGHGASRGFFTMKVVANHWSLVRTAQGWRVEDRIARTLNGDPEARALLESGAD
ncbi:nuclear transport factor 2 family protein [Novosphingobium sp. BL-52-GroH]|uniref:nuclear transport factor 2 family protein n=1 Tax=Novosphingobium sp. BL-52-GroH TaxID=3349877 RepID=UPI003850B0D8